MKNLDEAEDFINVLSVYSRHSYCATHTYICCLTLYVADIVEKLQNKSDVLFVILRVLLDKFFIVTLYCAVFIKL